MNRFLPFFIIASVALITAAVATMLYRSKQHTYASTIPARAADARLKPGHVRGPARAPVTLEEFGDFQCPACATTAKTIDSLANTFGDRLRLVFCQFPLPAHEHGREAALAAEAASQQGRFWEMHRLLYTNQASWSGSKEVRPQFERFAEELHLDPERFRKDIDNPSVAARVDAEHEYGVSRGVKGTPTLFINGAEFPPPFTPERLREAIENALKQPNKS